MLDTENCSAALISSLKLLNRACSIFGHVMKALIFQVILITIFYLTMYSCILTGILGRQENHIRFKRCYTTYFPFNLP